MLEVYLADVQSSGGIAQVIHTNSQVTSAVYLQATDVFTPPLSGSYYIGFHAQKSDSLVALFIDDINITTDTGGVGIKNPEKLNVSVYPNPSQGIVYLNTVQNSLKGFTIEVRNPLGQVILTKKCDRLKAFTLDLNEQPDGIYLVKVNSENGTYSTRVTISK
jgi:hypothetical protein